MGRIFSTCMFCCNEENGGIFYKCLVNVLTSPICGKEASIVHSCCQADRHPSSYHPYYAINYAISMRNLMVLATYDI